eukprot:3941217-Rhodomonas_salina.10
MPSNSVPGIAYQILTKHRTGTRVGRYGQYRCKRISVKHTLVLRVLNTSSVAVLYIDGILHGSVMDTDSIIRNVRTGRHVPYTMSVPDVAQQACGLWQV